MNFINQVFAGIGSSLQGQAQQAADAATQAFYVLAGELVIVIAILLAILLVLAFKG